MWRLFYHAVWSTEGGQAILEGDVRRLVYMAVRRKADELKVTVHALGGTKDHVHVVLTIPPQLAVADCIRSLKLASAQEVNRRLGPKTPLLPPLRWARGYGVFTFGERSLPTVVDYVHRQEVLHAEGETKPYYERMDDGR